MLMLAGGSPSKWPLFVKIHNILSNESTLDETVETQDESLEGKWNGALRPMGPCCLRRFERFNWDLIGVGSCIRCKRWVPFVRLLSE